VAQELGGEIVSADSRQIYRQLDIGTAKPTPDESRLARHHLISIMEPSEAYDAARFAIDAERAVASIISAGAEPILVGGTGFYVRSLFEGLFQGPGRDERVREKLEQRARENGSGILHEELKAVDPDSASRIHPNDALRIVRALEVYILTGSTLTSWQSRRGRKPIYAPVYFGLTMDRERLYARIDCRVDTMVAAGLIDEVRRLFDSAVLLPGLPAADAVGYREILDVLAVGGADFTEAVELIKRNTRRYSKRQMTWFSSIEGVDWLDMGEIGEEEAARLIVTRWREYRTGAN
jgi:tRNA dimethylallyltransferase